MADIESISSSRDDQGNKPAYVSYQTLRNFLRKLSEHELPDQIDSSLMSNLAYGTQSQLNLALRFLGLVDAEGAATPALVSLTRSVNDDAAWRDAVREHLVPRYAEITSGLNLKSGTSQQLSEAFKQKGNATGSINPKAVRFYLKVMDDAGIVYSQYFRPKKSTGSRSKRQGASRPKKTEQEEPQVGADSEPGMIEFPIYLRRTSATRGRIVVPEDFGESDVKMVEAAVEMLRVYAEQNNRAVEADEVEDEADQE